MRKKCHIHVYPSASWKQRPDFRRQHKLDGKELIGLPEKEMCRIRGNDIAMIFQDPMTALNPTLTIGTQLMEPIMLHQNCRNKKKPGQELWTF